MNKKDCTLLISSCDAYQDILDVFFILLKKFWPDLSYDISLSTETLNYKTDLFEINNIHPVNTSCSWTERIFDALHKIDSKYIILMLDDFFLYNTVKTDKIEECLEFLKRNSKIATFTFYPIHMSSLRCKYKDFKKREKNSLNKVTATLGLWNKNKLLKYLDGYKENIWQWEKNATIRSNTLYPKDEFYTLKNNADNIFPYDFNKYGLFSGKWLKSTKKLFDNLNIKFDFNIRGFYDESLRGLERSIISSFEMNSAIVPYYALTHKGSSYIEFKKGTTSKHVANFNQLYNISGARSIVRWEPSTHWGFGVKNLNIKIIYKDKQVEEINNSKLFGSFIKIKNLYVFNCVSPNMYIPTTENKIISNLTISGTLVFPLAEQILKISYNKKTYTNNSQHKILSQYLWHEFLVSKEKLYHIDIDSVINIYKIDGQKEENIQYKQNFIGNRFIQSFFIKENDCSIDWIASQFGGFAIKNLTILLFLKNYTYKRVLLKNIDNLPKKIDNMYIFLSSQLIHFNIPHKQVKKVFILGNFICPIKNSILKKLLYDQNN